jgi:hypothetical protein
MASKVWDDFAMTNRDYSQIFKNMSLPILNEMERALLSLFNYQLTLSPAEFVFYNSTFSAMILDAKIKNSIQLLTQQKNKSLSCSSPPLSSRDTSVLKSFKPSQSSQVLLVSTLESSTSNRTASVYSSSGTSTTIERDEGEGEGEGEGDDDDVSEDQDGGREISPLPLHLCRRRHQFSSSSRFPGYPQLIHLPDLSPVISEIISRSHSFPLTPNEESNFIPSISSCTSERKRLFAEDILKLKDLQSESETETGTEMKTKVHEKAADLEALLPPLAQGQGQGPTSILSPLQNEIKFKSNLFSLFCQNKILPISTSTSTQTTTVSGGSLSQEHTQAVRTMRLSPTEQQSFHSKPSQLFSIFPFRQFFSSSSSSQSSPLPLPLLSPNRPPRPRLRLFHSRVHMDEEVKD